ncbi:hypothetical protein CVS40_8219 [Lucilia cuprina]|nr:hypothetical protein CVS40_8219 [Lucilia cuprina]
MFVSSTLIFTIFKAPDCVFAFSSSTELVNEKTRVIIVCSLSDDPHSSSSTELEFLLARKDSCDHRLVRCRMIHQSTKFMLVLVVNLCYQIQARNLIEITSIRFLRCTELIVLALQLPRFNHSSIFCSLVENFGKRIRALDIIKLMIHNKMMALLASRSPITSSDYVHSMAPLSVTTVRSTMTFLDYFDPMAPNSITTMFMMNFTKMRALLATISLITEKLLSAFLAILLRMNFALAYPY